MTEKITIRKVDHLPMPLIYLASAEDLARWQADQLRWAYEHGERRLNLSCFDTASMGFDIVDAAAVVLDSVMYLLCGWGDVESLAILCGDENAYRAYAARLDEWLAAHQTPDEH